MNNFIKKVSVVLAIVLMVSSMVISASAVSGTESSCAGSGVQTKVYSVSTNTNNNGYLTSVDVNALLGELGSKCSTVPAGNTTSADVAGTTGDCTNGTAQQPSAVSDATDATDCNGSTCTANANCSGSSCTTSTCTAKSECISDNCTANEADATSENNADVSKCAIISDDSTSACTANSTLIDRINSALSKCGLNIKSFRSNLSGSTDTTVTATPTPSANTDTTATAPTDTTATTGSGSVDNQSFEAQVAELVNEQRAANGLAPLTLSTELSNVARTKSQDMHDNNYFSHTSPTYGSPFDMLKSFGISYRAAGENIAMGYATPEAVVTAWMNSAGHRANILNASYTQIGVGYVADGNYWTQEFIG